MPAAETVEERPAPEAPGAKERLAEAAIHLFCQKGFEGTSIREIVEAAGVAKPSLYYYYKNKEGLFQNIIEDALTEFARKLEDACAGLFDTFAEQLQAIENIYISGAREKPELIRFIHSVVFSGMYDDRFEFEQRWRENLEMLFSVFDTAQKAGELRDDIPANALALQFIGLAESGMKAIVYCPKLTQGLAEHIGAARVFLDGARKR